MPRTFLSAVLVAPALALAASAQIPSAVESTFETGTEGWTHAGAAVFQQEPAGGHPGGRLYIDNSEGPVTYVYAPAKFLGDWSGFKNGTFRFDGAMIGTGGSPWTTPLDYGHVWITGGGMVMSADLSPALPSGGWVTYSLQLTPAHWGVPQWMFDGIMAGVTQVQISVEALFGDEVQALDNVRLEPPGLPATCTVFNGSGVNPLDFSCVTTPAVGANWQSTIAQPAGTLLTVVVVSTQVGFTPVGNPLGTGELLIDILDAFHQFGNGNHSFAIPNNPTLVGLTIDTQGYRAMAPFGIAALNGIRLNIGL